MTAVSQQKSIIHLVDDDESLRTALGRLLRAAGYEVRSYASAGEFSLALSEQLTGCVLLDVRMPGPNGFDLQAALLRNGSALPIIFLTGHGDIPMSVRAMKGLTAKEREVFARVTAGQPNKQIAGEFDLSERTVKAHRAEAMRKMGASSLAELVLLAEELRAAAR